MPNTPDPVNFISGNNRSNFDTFHQIYTEEPHFERRKQILAAHPEVKELYVKEWRTIPILIAILIAHFSIVYYAPYTSTFTYCCLAYFGSATFIHMIFIINHDLTHFTCVSQV